MRSGRASMPTSSALRIRGSAASLLPTLMASDCHHASTTYRRVQSRVDRGHVVGWSGLAVYLRHLSKGYANPRFSQAHLGLPGRPQRLKALGNAVMPDMARLVGECVLRREARKTSLMQ
jgi:hypothetical protein